MSLLLPVILLVNPSESRWIAPVWASLRLIVFLWKLPLAQAKCPQTADQILLHSWSLTAQPAVSLPSKGERLLQCASHAPFSPIIMAAWLSLSCPIPFQNKRAPKIRKLALQVFPFKICYRRGTDWPVLRQRWVWLGHGRSCQSFLQEPMQGSLLPKPHQTQAQHMGLDICHRLIVNKYRLKQFLISRVVIHRLWFLKQTKKKKKTTVYSYNL